VRGAVTIHGADYTTPDGTCVRDYVHVTDLAAAHVAALRALERAPPGFDAYNLGSGRGHCVAEVLAAVRRVTGRAVATTIGPRRPGDAAQLVADARRIGRELGWRPTFTSLGAIVDSAWRWTRRLDARRRAEPVAAGAAATP
jgi:UDP-glucose 4-epimerase